MDVEDKLNRIKIALLIAACAFFLVGAIEGVLMSNLIPRAESISAIHCENITEQIPIGNTGKIFTSIETIRLNNPDYKDYTYLCKEDEQYFDGWGNLDCGKTYSYEEGLEQIELISVKCGDEEMTAEDYHLVIEPYFLEARNLPYSFFCMATINITSYDYEYREETHEECYPYDVAAKDYQFKEIKVNQKVIKLEDLTKKKLDEYCIKEDELTYTCKDERRALNVKLWSKE